MGSNNKFMDHQDPTTPIPRDILFDSLTIESQYNLLTEREKLVIGSKLLGMNHIPVSFEQFLNDDYFLGNPSITNHGKQVFNSWKKVGKELYPNPLTNRYPYVSFGGCIGSGKSSMSRFMGLYNYHKLDCCTNPFLSLGLAGGTKIAFGFFHASEETARKDFVQYFRTVFDISPYFKNQYNRPPIRLVSAGPKSVGSVIGLQLIFSVLSEIGFWRPQDAMNKMSEVLIRYQSRFISKRMNFGGIVLDSSAKDADHSVADKFEESVPSSEIKIVKFSHWEARPELYRESNGVTFDFYRGDSIRTPHVLEDNENREELDPDRIIKCPIQTKHNFLLNPIRSLQDLAGFGYNSKELLFQGTIEHIMNCSTLSNSGFSVIDDIDFYDLDDTIYDRVFNQIMRIPKHTSIFIHADLGLKKDVTGLAICYFDKEIYDSTGFDNTPYPTFVFPLLIGISRRNGQSTSLDHIFQFIQKLNADYTVHVSADSFASAGLFQSCERAGIPYEELSVDKTTEPYFMFKNVVNSERCKLMYNERFLRECSELRVVTNGKNGTHVKIDHPDISSCFEFDYKNAIGEQPGTKDIADAVVGSLWACYKKYSEYLEDGGNGVNKQLRAITSITQSAKEETNKYFQDMLEGIFG